MDKYNQAKSLLSSKYPRGIQMEEVFNELLDTFLSKKLKVSKQRKSTEQNSQSSAKSNLKSRYIPKHLRTKVYQRDQGKCSFVSTDGVKCDSSWDIEIDHIKPYALGGEHTEDNLRLLCRCHNQMRSRETFGKKY